ncbi:hypothetical protein DL546_008515 [Coniochaeta pulveracea]|uniref:Uncharacterized protein n=1 Tax=Coniochaeta pulveracea TaxID=177199 RepID=A0A420YGN3_9PEZI|nr:hypothetical protein DL546_008515 [Coniochaeta pulveracea]
MPRGGQRTFVSVPNPLGMQGLIDRSSTRGADEVRSLPPMTSKQAKKLAQKKNKELNKKMSKEEERRLKLEALNDAIKKEEQARREKKAAMVREKKLEKERKRLEERKSKGLPLIDVRPSQDTITKFLRGNGTDRKRDSTGAQLEAVPEDNETPEPDTTTAAEDGILDEQAQRQQPVQRLPSPNAVPEDTKQAASTKPFKRFRTGCTPKKEDKRAKTVAESKSSLLASIDATGTGPEHSRMSREVSLEAQAPDRPIEPLGHANQAAQPRSRVLSLPVKPNSKLPIDKENEPPISPPAKRQDSSATKATIETATQRKPLLGNSGNSGKASNRETPSHGTFVDEGWGDSGQIMDALIHCETEYARNKHDLADFLPTPSQEIREIQGEYSKPAIPSAPKPPVRVPTQPARQIKPSMWKPTPPVWKPAVSATPLTMKAPSLLPRTVPALDLASLLSTQDLSFSSQDIRELDETPSRLLMKPFINQASRPAVDIRTTVPPYNRSVTGASAPGMNNTGRMMGQGFPAPATGPKQDVTMADRLHQPVHTNSSQRHSALSQAARYRKRPSHSGTPQPRSSMQSSAGVTQETPCRAVGSSSRTNAVSYGSRYSSSAARRQTVTSTPAAQPIPITALNAVSPRSSRSPLSPAKSASLPNPDPVSVHQPLPEVQVFEPRAESPKPSVSPPKKRFLTSSNVEITLAMQRSEKTFQEEQRKRELKEREEDLARQEEERRQHMERGAESHHNSPEGTDFLMDDILDDMEEDMDAQHKFMLEKSLSQQVYAAISQGKRHMADVDIVVSSTQETDYGDLDLSFVTQPFRTQVYLARGGSQPKKRENEIGTGNASQETDYGDLYLGVDDVEQFLEQVDFSDDDYP